MGALLLAAAGFALLPNLRAHASRAAPARHERRRPRMERDVIAMTRPARPRAPRGRRWALDPGLVFLNHGSFGACPRAVLDAQSDLRAELEANPVAFLGRGLDDRLAAARAAVAAFVGRGPRGPGLRAERHHRRRHRPGTLRLGPGDEIAGHDHEYNAALNVARFAAPATGARVVVARIPLPVDGPDEVAERILGGVTRGRVSSW